MKRLICIAALSAFAALAEDKPPPQGPPQPPEEMKVEKWFVGTWTCTGQRHAGPMGPEGKTATKLKMKLDLMGFWLEIEGTALAGPMKGKEVFEAFASWDGTQHRRYGFQAGGMMLYTTKGWDGDKLVFDGEGMVMGQKLAMKHTITKKGDNAFDSAFESAGKPVQEESCTRAAAAAKK